MRLVEEAMQPGLSISYVARRAGIAPSQLFAWKRRMLEGGTVAVQADEDVVGASRVRELEKRVRDLERMLGRKTMDAEILKEALPVLRLASLVGWSQITTTLEAGASKASVCRSFGIARSILIDTFNG